MQTLWFFFRCSTCSTDHNKSIVISSIGRSVTLDIVYVWRQRPPFPNIWMKETKAQYARDDPAFLVLLSAVLIVTSAGFSFTLGDPSAFTECIGNYWFSNIFRYSLLGLCQVPALRDICWYGEILLFRNIRFVILVQNCTDDHPHVILIADDNLPRWEWAWFSPLCSGGSATPSSSSLLTGIRLYHWSSWHENAFHQLWFAHSMKTIMIILVAIGVCDESAIGKTGIRFNLINLQLFQ